MAHAYIVENARTAGGRRGGALRDWHPANLGAEVLNALVARSGIDGAVIDDVIVGCVSQGGEQSFAFGRPDMNTCRIIGYLVPRIDF